MIGALAVACFVKVYGSVFLGDLYIGGYHAVKLLSMRLPMALAGTCILIGFAPFWSAPFWTKQ